MHLAKESINLLLLLISLSSFFLSSALFLRVAKRRRKYFEKVRLAEMVKLEEERIAKLPKLNTKYLLPVPEFLADKFYGPLELRPKRVWASRNQMLIVLDDRGFAWLGFEMPETYQSFKDGEYCRANISVCIETSNPLEIDGKPYATYPAWFSKDTPTQQRRQFVELRKIHFESFLMSAGLETIHRIYPLSDRVNTERQREWCEQLKKQLASS